MQQSDNEITDDDVEIDHALARETLDACPDAILTADEQGVIEWANGPAERLFGCERAQLIGRTIDALLPGRTRELTSRRQQLHALRSDGSEIPVEIGLSLHDLGGATHIIASVRDISERIRAEQRVRLIDRCIDAASDAILVFDENNLRLLHANRGAVRMFGYETSELLGSMSPTDLFPEFGLCQFATALGPLREAPDQHIRMVTTGRAKSGAELPVEIQVDWPAPIRPNGARPVLAVIRLLTETRLD